MITTITAKARTHMDCVHQKTTKVPWEQNDISAPIRVRSCLWRCLRWHSQRMTNLTIKSRSPKQASQTTVVVHTLLCLQHSSVTGVLYSLIPNFIGNIEQIRACLRVRISLNVSYAFATCQKARTVFHFAEDNCVCKRRDCICAYGGIRLSMDHAEFCFQGWIHVFHMCIRKNR